MHAVVCNTPKRSVWSGAVHGAATVMLAVVTGCTALPQLNADTTLTSAQPAKMAGATGALSPRTSTAILAKLGSRTDETGIFERHLALEEAIVGSPLVVSNKTTLYQDGEATYAAMFKAIAAAQDHVNIETYIIEDDEIGRKFSDALIERQQKGVAVALIYDSVGSLQTPKEFFQRLRDSGVKTLEFNPVNPLEAKEGWEVNQRDHRKLLIVDGESVFLGGINISSVHSSGSSRKRAAAARNEDHTPWRDTHLLIEGPVVADFQKLFIATWNKQKGEALPDRKYFPPQTPKGREVVRAIGSSSDDASGKMYNTLLSAIGSAETSVYLTNAYFAPDEKIMKVLGDAVRRGVDVKIILPGKTDSGLIFHAGRSFYSELLQSGVKIYERSDALLHAKTALIDGVWSTVGSTNLDWRSFLHNDEVNAVVLGTAFGTQMNTMFDRDLAASQRITLESWRDRPIALRLKEQAARIWVYWL